MKESFLGTGWSFPPEFSKSSEMVVMSSDEKDIKESLEIILTTRLGERIMKPNFGCNIEEALFKPLNLTLVTDMKNRIENAILYFEPRIDVNNIDLDDSNETDGILLIKVDFTIRSTNTRSNMVYPFYRIEATNL
ncbi:MAG TPA: GPW/gp25 family protein [Brumimicrobium sp.]|nr:GPW/gp25 family protein [Brumimicrobium sp.]